MAIGFVSAGLKIVLLYFALAVAFQALIVRARCIRNSVIAFLAAGCVLGLMFIAHAIAQYGMNDRVLVVCLVYAFLSELYIFSFTFVKSSVSTALVMSLVKSPLAESGIDAALGSQNMVEGRLEAMVKTGFLMRCGSGYTVTRQGKFLAQCFSLMKRIFRNT